MRPQGDYRGLIREVSVKSRLTLSEKRPALYSSSALDFSRFNNYHLVQVRSTTSVHIQEGFLRLDMWSSFGSFSGEKAGQLVPFHVFNL